MELFKRRLVASIGPIVFLSVCLSICLSVCLPPSLSLSLSLSRMTAYRVDVISRFFFIFLLPKSFFILFHKALCKTTAHKDVLHLRKSLSCIATRQTSVRVPRSRNHRILKFSGQYRTGHRRSVFAWSLFEFGSSNRTPLNQFSQACTTKSFLFEFEGCNDAWRIYTNNKNNNKRQRRKTTVTTS